jgi:peptidoglycan/xylan/chitin deacetylase (PgdA/CDA1 family)
MNGIVYVMYHEVERDGRPLCHRDPGYVRYVLSEEAFTSHMEVLARNGQQGISVGDALTASDLAQAVAITFDDGSETDSLVAAPLLARYNFRATFYVVTNWINRRGWLSSPQLRDLADAGFEIGCHSRSHAFLSDLEISDLKNEIVTGKDELEQILGRRIEHFSCPGGRWSQRVSQVAREAGYRSVVTSRTGINYAKGDPYRLARVAILRGTSPDEFLRTCRGDKLRVRRGQELLLSGAKTLLGNSTYQRLREVLLKTP